MESTKWKKQQDEGDRVAEVVQEEYGNADPDLGNVLEEDNAVDPGVENGDAPAAEEDADAPLLEGEEGEDVRQLRLNRNKLNISLSILLIFQEIVFRIHFVTN